MLVANSEYDKDNKEGFWPLPGAIKDLEAMR